MSELGLLLLGCASPTAGLRGWERVCHGAPHPRLTPRVVDGLHQASVHPGFQGWQPTVEWVNEQCDALGRS